MKEGMEKRRGEKVIDDLVKARDDRSREVEWDSTAGEVLIKCEEITETTHSLEEGC